MESPPRTPPPQSPSIQYMQSTPVKVSQHYAEHKRDEVQSFAHNDDENHPPLTKKEFLDFLDVSHITIPVPDPLSAITFAKDTFVKDADKVSASVKLKYFSKSSLLVFKSTGEQAPLHHVTSTSCRPDVIALFEQNWKANNTLWSCIEMVGEVASKGKSKDEQLGQAESYLHFLVLARPDLHVAQGFLIRPDGIKFLFGIGGEGIKQLSVLWGDKQLYSLMYAFIYRIYEPGAFRDRSYVEKKLEEDHVSYKIRVEYLGDKGKRVVRNCPGFRLVYAVNPFRTRTQILRNEDSAVKINGKIAKIIKDQLCRSEARFQESEILKRIHEPRVVPGVVEVAFEEEIQVDPRLLVNRRKFRIGLQQSGDQISDVRNLKALLEILYDLLEVLRYLYANREVLHRDISKGNVLYSKGDTPTALGDGAPTKDIHFIKHLLDERIDAWKTSVLLIDFNRGAHLAGMRDPHGLNTKTGTPLFIARAVELKGPVPFPRRLALIPPIPIPNDSYSQKYPDRILKFSPTGEEIMRTPAPDSANRPWHHDLDHDAESVFWLLIHWAMIAQPVGSIEQIDPAYWHLFTGNYKRRNTLLNDFASGSGDGFAHSFFDPLLPLIEMLAAVLAVDRHWIPKDDPRNDPQYVPEAFQRLIFQFLLDHGTETFMTQNIESKPRPHVTMYSTPTLTVSAYSTGSKRPSRGSSPNRKRRKGKGRKRDQIDDDADHQPSE